MFKNFGLPTKYQWKRIFLNTIIYFIGSLAGFLGYINITTGSVIAFDFTFTTFVAALAAAGGATVKFFWTLIFEKPIN